eukprot:scaffold229285_cov33-Tisochrysis_lutea.AAC.1
MQSIFRRTLSRVGGKTIPPLPPRMGSVQVQYLDPGSDGRVGAGLLVISRHTPLLEPMCWSKGLQSRHESGSTFAVVSTRSATP